MDEFAISSLTRAKAAIASGAFAKEIVPVEVKTRKTGAKEMMSPSAALDLLSR